MHGAKTVSIRIRVSVLLRDTKGRLCLVRHLKDGRRYWLLPGGGQDPLETVHQAAARELQEELNVSVEGLRFLFVRESMCPKASRHIQFLVFEGINPDYSNLSTGTDSRVEGYDFFSQDEMIERTVYPSFKQDLVDFVSGRSVEPFKTLDWAE